MLVNVFIVKVVSYKIVFLSLIIHCVCGVVFFTYSVFILCVISNGRILLSGVLVLADIMYLNLC